MALLLDGGDGDDIIEGILNNGATAEMFGDLGSDIFRLSGTDYSATVDGGAGDDFFKITMGVSAEILLSLGAGRDTVQILSGRSDASLVIADFETGELGDSIDLTYFYSFTDWGGDTNPFVEGHIELVQVGADTVLMAKKTLASDAYALVTFLNTNAADFTFSNFGHMADGSDAPTQYWVGTDENDQQDGTIYDDHMSGGGNDSLRGRAGHDILRGEAGDDNLYGYEGDDILHGGVGSDRLDGGSGNNQLYGGEGSDDLIFGDSDGGVTLLDGGNGNDDFFIDVSCASVANAFGGGNNDSFWLEGNRGNITADGGSGNDLFVVRTKMSAIELTMGDGVDTLRFGYFYTTSVDACVTINDFATGEGGDYVDVSNYLDAKLPNFDATANPFRTGYVQLVQMGADTHLQYAGDLSAETVVFTTMAIFQNTSVADFGYDNFGFTPDGSGVPGVTWEGTSEADTYDGSKDDDHISGLDGNDTLRGNSGDDEIYGGGGNDVIEGGNDYDTLYGNAGSDHLVSTAGNDFLYGGDGNDILTITTQIWAPAAEVFASGGNGDDILSVDLANTDSVTLIGGLGNDKFYLSGTGGTILAQGGAGADFYNLELGATRVTLVLGADQDVVRLAELDASDFTNQVTITDFATGDDGDRVNFRTFLETIVRTWDRAGDPFAQGLVQIVQVGADSHLQFASSSGGDFTTAVVFKNTAASEFTSYNLDYASFSDADIPGESWSGTEADDTYNGSEYADELSGLGGNDTLRGGYGNDVIRGGDGNGDLTGQQGNDVLFGGDGDDALFGADGDDTLTGGLGVDKPYADLGDDYLDGGAGDDEMGGDAGGDSMDGGDDDDTMHGGDGWDTLHGGTGWDIMYGDAGNDRLFGGYGNDIIDGGDDDDYIEGGDGRDELTGGGGDDEVLGGLGDDQLKGLAGNDVLLGHEGFDSLAGGTGNDTLDGGLDDDSLLGEEGDDPLYGGAGFDELFGGAGADTLHGDADNDYLNGGEGDDAIYGGDHADTLEGMDGSDTLDGGNGDDVMAGGLGADTLTGGFGADVFVFYSALGNGNVDTITDFAAGTDGIVLDRNIFRAIASEGVLDAGAFRTGTSAGDADDRIIYNKNTGEIFYDADGSGSGAKVLFAKVAAGTNLTASSFEAYYIQSSAEAPSDKVASAWAPAALPVWDLVGSDLPLF